MKNLICLLALAFTCSVSAADQNQPESEKIATSWTLTDNQNKTITFPQHAIEQQQVTVLFFWATWCPYCKQLMPHIQSALYQYQQALNLKVYALNINEDADPRAYLQSQGYTFQLFEKAEKVAQLYQIYGTPGVLIFNQQGELVFDLRRVQSDHLINQKATNTAKSVRIAPYWAAEIRKALQDLLNQS